MPVVEKLKRVGGGLKNLHMLTGRGFGFMPQKLIGLEKWALPANVISLA